MDLTSRSGGGGSQVHILNSALSYIFPDSALRVHITDSALRVHIPDSASRNTFRTLLCLYHCEANICTYTVLSRRNKWFQICFE